LIFDVNVEVELQIILSRAALVVKL